MKRLVLFIAGLLMAGSAVADINTDLINGAKILPGSIPSSAIMGGGAPTSISLTSDCSGSGSGVTISISLTCSGLLGRDVNFTGGAGVNVPPVSQLGALSISSASAAGTGLSIQGLASQTGPYFRTYDNFSNVLQTFLPISASDPRAKFNLYNTLESAPTNYERLSFYFDNPNNLGRIETQSGGSGTLRALALQGPGGRTLIGGTTDDLSTKLQVNGSLGIRGTNYVVAVPGVASTVDRVDWMAQTTNSGINFNLFPNGTSATSSVVVANQNSQTNFGSAYLKIIGATAYIGRQSVGSPTTAVSALSIGNDPTTGQEWTTVAAKARVLIGTSLPTDDGSTALQVNGAGRFALGSSGSSALNFGTANTGLYGVSSTAFAATVGGVPTVTFNANNIQVQDAAGANTTKNFRLFQTTYGGTNPFTLFVSNSSSNPSNGVTFGGGTSLGEPASFVRFNVGTPGTLGSGTTAIEAINSGTGIPRIGINLAVGTQTAQLHIAAGTATGSTAPLKFTAGTNLTTTEAGAVEFNGTNLEFSPSTAGTRFNVALDLSGTSGSIGGSALAAGACASGTVTVTGATTGMAAVASAAGGTDPGDAYYVRAFVSSSNTAVVKVCAAIAGTPTSTTYNVRVFQ